MKLYSIEALPILSKSIKLNHQLFFVPEFISDSEQLVKSFSTLGRDLQTFLETSLKVFHDLELENDGIKELEFNNIKTPKIYKAKKFACQSLKGKGANTGIKVIYAHHPEEKKIDLIEIYFEGDKQEEDKNRIFRYYSN